MTHLRRTVAGLAGLAGFVMVAVAALVTGCTLSEPSKAPTPTLAPVTPATENPEAVSGDTELAAALAAVVADVEATFGGQLGIATAADEDPVAEGFLEASPAWSTIKVPIAVAALRAHPEYAAEAEQAIAVSDNDAAERLFTAAGAESVNKVLDEAGLSVNVNEAQLRPGFSTFGQTALSVADEALLAAQLSCVAGAGPVLEIMGRIDPSQAYGLGSLEGALFKGGWGPDTVGKYQVRQFGLIPLGDGTYAPIALTALPADGEYATGQAMLTHAALALSTLPEPLPTAACQPSH